MYSEKVMERFMQPQNIGEIPDPDGVGVAENPLSGDLIQVFLKIVDSSVTDARYKCFGCPVLIAAGDWLMEAVRGKDLRFSEGLSRDAVASSLEGLPPNKLHCANLAIDALKLAVADYRTRGAERRKGERVLLDWHNRLAPRHAHVHLS